MPNPEDLVDRYLDQLAAGNLNEAPGIEPERVVTARKLFNLHTPMPSPAFLDALQERLSITVQTQPIASSSRQAKTNAHLRDTSPAVAIGGMPHVPRKFMPVVASALILAIIAGLGLIFILHTSDSPQHQVAVGIPAPTTPEPTCPYSETAYVDQQTQARMQLAAQYHPLLIAELPGIQRFNEASNAFITVIPDIALPTGAEPSPSDRQAIETSMLEDVACRSAFFSDGEPTDLSHLLPGVTSPKLVAGFPPYVFPAPEIVSMTTLSDGRIGVRINDDPRQPDVDRYLVMAPLDGRWVVSEAALVATSDWIGGRSNGVLSDDIIIEIYNSDFVTVTGVDIPGKRPVTITLVNSGTKVRHFKMPDLGISVVVSPGQSTSVQITVAVGGYLFLIDIDDPAHSYSTDRGWFWAHEPLATPSST